MGGSLRYGFSSCLRLMGKRWRPFFLQIQGRQHNAVLLREHRESASQLNQRHRSAKPWLAFAGGYATNRGLVDSRPLRKLALAKTLATQGKNHLGP